MSDLEPLVDNEEGQNSQIAQTLVLDDSAPLTVDNCVHTDPPTIQTGEDKVLSDKQQTTTDPAPPPQSANNATSPPQSVDNATPPPQSVTNATSPPQSEDNATPPPQSVTDATSLPQSVTDATSLSQSVDNATSPAQSVSDAISPAQSVSDATPLLQSVRDATPPPQSVSDATPPPQSVSDATSLPPAGSGVTQSASDASLIGQYSSGYTPVQVVSSHSGSNDSTPVHTEAGETLVSEPFIHHSVNGQPGSDDISAHLVIHQSVSSAQPVQTANEHPDSDQISDQSITDQPSPDNHQLVEPEPVPPQIIGETHLNIQAEDNADAPLGGNEGIEKKRIFISCHIEYSVLSILLFIPFGIIAIYHTIKTTGYLRKRKIAEAVGSSRRAYRWASLAIITGPLLCVAAIVVLAWFNVFTKKKLPGPI